MTTILAVSNSVIILLFVVYHIFTSSRIRKIYDEIENINLEQSKISFRLFIAEKRQKMFQEKKII